MSELYAPLDMSTIVARLRSQVPALREVGEAAEFAAITQRAGPMPAAYAMLESEDFDSELMTEHGTLVCKHLVSIVVAVQNARVSRGDVHAAEASIWLGRVRGALIGWEPAVPDGWSIEQRLQLEGRAKCIGFDAQAYYWRDGYTLISERVQP